MEEEWGVGRGVGLRNFDPLDEIQQRRHLFHVKKVTFRGVGAVRMPVCAAPASKTLTEGTVIAKNWFASPLVLHLVPVQALCI
ncbi:hypothetical protein EVAR_55928_1 [Eumeta japonica]|uniref:Uncharacterized protein n=1 Tax=Eumeta variegata TaxID=151549 RepID=A0A4C1YXY1_EUMVA|nr:hypothetical protein EVAR_55928_1 [Eumeta japonica]